MASFSTISSLGFLSAAVLAAAIATSASAGDRVYVPLGSDDKIVIVDSETNKILGEINGLPAIHGLAVTPDGRYLVAGSYDERPVGKAPSKPKGVTADEHAAHHAPKSQNPAGGAVVSSLSILSVPDHAVVRRIDVPGGVHHVVVGPSGRFVIATQPGQNAISIIDLGNYSVVTTIATGPLPNYAEFSPDGARAYVSNAGNGTISEIDTKRWIVRRNYVAGNSPEHIVLSRDGGTLYANNVDDGTVSVIDTSSGEAIKTIPIGRGLHGIDLSDDGRTLFVAAMDENKVVAVDLRGNTYRSIQTGPSPYHLAAIKDGKLYVTSAEIPKAWVIEQSSLAITGEIPIGGKAHQMVQVPDKERTE
ncbi:MAG: beta-propeller fold lactonase family protein [Candidatus Magasanikbacteria bacterium]|nr:beta-propeller fold lactonase family protein [Candidatus Magasanikbacteria bacterium]